MVTQLHTHCAGSYKTWIRHECVWTCVTIYLGTPCTGHNVYAGAYMNMPWDNDDAPAFCLLDWPGTLKVVPPWFDLSSTFGQVSHSWTIMWLFCQGYQYSPFLCQETLLNYSHPISFNTFAWVPWRLSNTNLYHIIKGNTLDQSLIQFPIRTCQNGLIPCGPCISINIQEEC